MRHFPATPAEMISSLWRNRELIHASAKREILGRYRGSTLGLLWSLFNPIFMLAVYTFVFSVVFKARWDTNSDSKTEFALVLFAGLIVFNLFSECINRAPTLITSNPNYVKKVVFPLEILPITSLYSAIFHTAVSIFVWLFAYIIFFGTPHLTVLYLPLIILPFCLLVLGLCWLLSSLGVFLRDVSQLTGLATTVMLFLSPIFFPATALPSAYQKIIYLNPLTPIIEQTRDVVFWGRSPDLMVLGVYWIAATLVAWLGFVWFQKTRRGFADVL